MGNQYDPRNLAERVARWRAKAAEREAAVAEMRHAFSAHGAADAQKTQAREDAKRKRELALAADRIPTPVPKDTDKVAHWWDSEETRLGRIERRRRAALARGEKSKDAKQAVRAGYADADDATEAQRLKRKAQSGTLNRKERKRLERKLRRARIERPEVDPRWQRLAPGR